VAPEAVGALEIAVPGIEHNAMARTALLRPTSPPELSKASVLIITAGTSDLPVAEEAAVTAAAMACRTERLTDVGVAGIHRLLARRDALDAAGVIIVVAGMDGALASVVGGLARVPVIAVPTSVGYGAAFHGLAPLLTMLNSCAAGVTVVNIDNGFGAAVAAARILHR
jgi:NCAIR mutase (PurE)-related protein